MIAKNLKYCRLKKGISKSELALRIGVSPMSISHYENNKRTPDLQTVRKLTAALGVKLADLLSNRSDGHNYQYAEFRRNTRLGKAHQEYIRENVEEYFDRFFCVVDALGDHALPSAPLCHTLEATGDAEADAQLLRKHLGFAQNGPLCNLVGAMEDKGILVYIAPIENDQFSGMNGTVDERPFIILNANMSAERQRSTLIHELAHLFFNFNGMSEKGIERHATAISGAFLFPKEDAIRELGMKRTRITQDMFMAAQEYGISMQMLVKRAQLLHIINDALYKAFMIDVSKEGGRKNEPSRIPKETTDLFEQLVLRAIGEEEISISKGAELLRISYHDMMQMMHPEQEA